MDTDKDKMVLKGIALQMARSKDPDFLNEHISENFMGIDPTGDRISKEGFLGLKLAPERKEIPRTYDNFDIMICAGGAAAVVIFDAVLFPGQEDEAIATFSQVYERGEQQCSRAVSSQVFVHNG